MPLSDETKSLAELNHVLVLSRSALKKLTGNHPLGRFNMFVALLITKSVGSMWCAYVFAIIACISLPAAIKSGDPIVIVGWIAQTFLQLVLLPIIIVGQNVQAEASDQRAQHDHDTLVAIHKLTTEIYGLNQQQDAILDALNKGAKVTEG